MIRILALAAVLAAASGCRPAEPPAAIVVAPREAPALAAWRLEPDDLLAQPLEPSAERWALSIVSGDGAVTEALREGFSVPESAAGRAFVWATGERSRVQFTLDEPVSSVLDLRVRPFAHPGAPPQSVTIALNGTALASLDVPAGGVEHEVPLPLALLRPGRNEIELSHAWSARPLDVIPGNADPRALAIAVDRLRILRSGPAIEAVTVAVDGQPPTGGLALHADGAPRWIFRAPNDASLELAWVAPRADGRPVALRVQAETDDGIRTLWSGSVPADGRAGERSVELAALGGRAVRLQLVANGLPPDSPWVWTRAALRGAPPPAPQAVPPSRPGTSVVLVVLDAAQRARFGLYGNERGTSPHLDALGGEALVFEDAVASASYTLASTASLFTGREPPRHGVVEKKHRLDTAGPTLAEILRDAGYATAAFSANIFVTRRYGMDRGFETFEELFRVPEHFPIVPADAFDGPVHGWLRAVADGARSGARPFFLYLHYIQPHEPYDVGPPEFYTGLDPAYRGPIDGRVETMYRVYDGSLALDDADRLQLERLYEGNLRYVDAAVGRLVERLRVLDLLERTLLIVTSDHGEALGERGLYGHNSSVDETMTAIPLLVRMPGGLVAQPQRIAVPVSTVDLAPLIVETVGLRPPPTFDGRNPLRALADGADGARPRYARTAGSRPDIGIWLGNAKCLLPGDGRPGRFGAEAAVDGGARETVDGVDVSRDLCRMARRAVESELPGRRASAVEALSEQEREVLKALGYLQD